MNRELLALRPDMSGDQARDLLRSFRVGAAPVLDDARRPIGVVSLRDLLDPGGLTRDRMTRPAICVSTAASIEAAARQLARTDMHHLVVVDGSGAAVGMLSSLDILRALVGIPARHPETFPHWDESTGVSWTDDWPLESELASHAPEAAGVLALTTGRVGERDAIVWVEACAGLRQRVLHLGSALAIEAGAEDPRLQHVLALHDLRFRAAVVPDESLREHIVALLRDRIEHGQPPGAT
jgi:CBS domain-containing protein